MRGAEEQRWSLSGDQWYNQREQHEVLTGEGQAGYQEKVIYQEGHQVLEQALLGSRHSTELMGTWEVFGQCYRSNGLIFGWSCVEPELDSMVFIGLWFCDATVTILYNS